VACTRARMVLSIPDTLKDFIKQCDDLHFFAAEESDSISRRFIFDQQVSSAQAQNIELDLIAPLRTKLNVQNGDKFLADLLLHSSSWPAALTPASPVKRFSRTTNVKPKVQQGIMIFFNSRASKTDMLERNSKDAINKPT
jgi:hypothetical protein